VILALSAFFSTRVVRRKKFGEVSSTKITVQRNNFELISTVKIETRNLVEGYFGSKFSVICNHCGVINGGLKSKHVKNLRKHCAFLKNDPFMVKFLKFRFESFYRDTDCNVVFKFCEIWTNGNR